MRLYGKELKFNDNKVYTESNLTKLSQLENDLSIEGQQGPPGKSAYEIAVEHGFNGTEEEWINSFVQQERIEKLEHQIKLHNEELMLLREIVNNFDKTIEQKINFLRNIEIQM